MPLFNLLLRGPRIEAEVLSNSYSSPVFHLIASSLFLHWDNCKTADQQKIVEAFFIADRVIVFKYQGGTVKFVM